MLTLVSALLLLSGEQEGDVGSASTMGSASASGGGGGESFEDRLNEIVDNVMHSKVMEELKVKSSEVMEELKNLPAELRESLLLHVERRSLVVAGVVVAIGAALLLLGCVWIHWCHTEHGEYRYIPVSQLEEFLRYQNPGSAASSSSHGHHHGQHSHRRRNRHSHHHHSSSSSHSGRNNKQGSSPSSSPSSAPASPSSAPASPSSAPASPTRSTAAAHTEGTQLTFRKTDHKHIANGGQ